MEYNTIIRLISSDKKSDNNEGFLLVKKMLDHCDDNSDIIKQLFDFVKESLISMENKNLYSAIYLSNCIFNHLNYQKLCICSSKAKEDLIMKIVLLSFNNDREVRFAANQFIKTFSLKESPLLMELSVKLLLNETNIINQNLLVEKNNQDKSNSFLLAKKLDNILQCLRFIIDSYTDILNPLVLEELVKCISLSSDCYDRFTRESSFYLLISIFRSKDLFTNINITYANIAVSTILNGLSDNFSQVRLPACLAAKELFNHVSEQVKMDFVKILLPGLCLNRYYTAQGVSHLSQEIWVKETVGIGQKLVEDNLESIISFYEKQLLLNNFEIHETVSICLNEVCLKLQKCVVQPHTERVFKMILDLLSHWHWSVRDSACITTSSFLTSYFDTTLQYRDVAIGKLFDKLSDSSPRVREAAAIALGNIAKLEDNSYMNIIFITVEKTLADDSISIYTEKKINSSQVFNDKVITHNNTNQFTITCLSDHKPETFNSHKSENQIVMKCPALAPEISQDKNKDIQLEKSLMLLYSNAEHSDIVLKHERRPESWEILEGFVCLLNQLSKVKKYQSNVIIILIKLKEIFEEKKYILCPYLMQSFLKQLPEIFAAMGKSYLKLHCEQFFDLIFKSASSPNEKVASEAKECICHLSRQFGQEMFKMRVQHYNIKYSNFC